MDERSIVVKGCTDFAATWSEFEMSVAELHKMNAVQQVRVKLMMVDAIIWQMLEGSDSSKVKRFGMGARLEPGHIHSSVDRTITRLRGGRSVPSVPSPHLSATTPLTSTPASQHPSASQYFISPYRPTSANPHTPLFSSAGCNNCECGGVLMRQLSAAKGYFHKCTSCCKVYVSETPVSPPRRASPSPNQGQPNRPVFISPSLHRKSESVRVEQRTEQPVEKPPKKSQPPPPPPPPAAQQTVDDDESTEYRYPPTILDTSGLNPVNENLKVYDIKKFKPPHKEQMPLGRLASGSPHAIDRKPSREGWTQDSGGKWKSWSEIKYEDCRETPRTGVELVSVKIEKDKKKVPPPPPSYKPSSNPSTPAASSSSLASFGVPIDEVRSQSSVSSSVRQQEVSQSFSIVIKTLSGEEMPLKKIAPTTTIEAIRMKLIDSWGPRGANFKFIHNGQEWTDDKTIADAGLSTGGVLHAL